MFWRRRKPTPEAEALQRHANNVRHFLKQEHSMGMYDVGSVTLADVRESMLALARYAEDAAKAAESKGEGA